MGQSLLAAWVMMAQGIAQGYPGDAGIQGHPDVVLTEMFDEASVANVAARWTNVGDNGSLSLDPDVPAGSAGTRSLKIIAAAGTNGGYLYRMLSPGQNDRVYFRYYVKYLSGDFHHSGGWLGGYNPPTPWPQGNAGIVPTGADRFTIGFEPVTTGLRADFYTYWKDMQGIWGNHFLNNPAVVFTRDTWTCVEIMVKMNNPVSANNGELAVWINGTLTGGPYGNLQWRTVSGLNLNFIQMHHYADVAPKGALKYDHVVVARSYVGPIAGTGTGTTTAPAITQQPQNKSVTAGQTATFMVTASGTAPLSYQWQKQDPGGTAFADIAGATAASYTTASTTAAMNGTQFRVRVSNSAGNVTSSAATLTVSVSADSDSDGLPDAWEQQHFGALSQTGGGDPDSDGSTNLQEFQAGTDPMAPPPSPGALPTSGSGGGSSDDNPCGFGTVSGAAGPSSRTLFLAAISLMLSLLRRR